MCAASGSSARLLNQNPATTSASMKPPVRPSAASGARSSPRAAAVWSCPAPIAASVANRHTAEKM